MEQSWPGAPWAGLSRTLLLAGCGGACVFMLMGACVFILIGAGLLVGAGVAVVSAELFNGAPTGISQRWPGAPWAGLSAAVPVLLLAGALIRLPGLLESCTGATGNVLVVGVAVALSMR